MAEAALILNYIQLALAALCILGLLFRALILGPFRPYFGASISALAYLLVPILLLVGNDESYVLGIYFLSAITTPMLWFNVFDSIYAASKGKKLASCNLFGVQPGYLWTLVMVICAIGVCATLGTAYNGGSRFSAVATQGAIYFLAYGLWAYALLALLQLLSDRSDIQHFSGSLYAYIFLLIAANIGVTIDAAAATSYNGPSFGLSIAILILSRYFGLFAIFVIVVTGHNWHRNQDTGKTIDDNGDVEENRA